MLPKPFTPLALSLAALRTATASSIFTGDVLNGHPVISHLDLSQVSSCNVTRYYLRLPDLAGDSAQHLPIFVARGPEETLETGTKLSISASIHGNELNPVRVAQKTLEWLEGNVETLNGTVIGTPALNPSGIYLSQRTYYEGGNQADYDLNRFMPGQPWTFENPTSVAQIYDDLVWTNVWGNGSNVDVAVDFHTAGAGSFNPLWVYADTRIQFVDRMARLAEPDVLKVDEGQIGTVETTFVQADIPAITYELGEALTWNDAFIERGFQYNLRLMGDLNMIPTEEVYQPDLSNTYVGKIFQSIPCQYAGFMELLVDVLDDVEEGTELARIRNHWGDVLETISSPTVGKVFSLRSDPAIGPGNSIGSLIYNSTLVPDCEAGCVVSGRKVPTGGDSEGGGVRRRRI